MRSAHALHSATIEIFPTVFDKQSLAVFVEPRAGMYQFTSNCNDQTERVSHWDEVLYSEQRKSTFATAPAIITSYEPPEPSAPTLSQK